MIKQKYEQRTNRQIRVIIADDHRYTRTVLREYLTRSPDIRIIAEAANGREAIDQTNALDPDVLILDMEMVGLSGVDVIRILQPGKNKNRVHIIALSAHDDRQYILSVLELGIDRYIIKDEPIRKIVDSIRQSIERDKKPLSHTTRHVSASVQS